MNQVGDDMGVNNKQARPERQVSGGDDPERNGAERRRQSPFEFFRGGR
jgi:hypothetical protein